MKIALIIIVLFSAGWMMARFSFTNAVARHFGPSLLAAFAMISIAGMIVPNPIIYLATCFGACLIGVRSRLDAACRFLLLSALTPNITYQATIGGNYLLAIHPTTGFLIALGSFALLIPKRSGSMRLSAEDGVIAALVLIAIVAESRTPSATALIRQVLTPILAIVFPYLLLTRNISDRSELTIFFGVVAGCAMILAVFSIYEATFGWSLFDGYWASFQTDYITRNLRMRSGFLRTPTTFNESTAFALFQMFGVLSALYSRRLYRSTIAWVASCGLVMIALLAAQSRGALIGLFAGLAIAFLYRRSYLRSVIVVGSVAALVTALLALARFNHKAASFVDADAALVGQDYRQRLLSAGLSEGMKHFWIGQDRETTNIALQTLIQGEHIVDFVNTYLTIFLNSGIVGLTTFIVPLCFVFATLWRRRDLRQGGSSGSDLDNVVGPLSAILTALIFTSFYERNPLWLIVGLAASKILTRPVPFQHLVARGTGMGAPESGERTLISPSPMGAA